MRQVIPITNIPSSGAPVKGSVPRLSDAVGEVFPVPVAPDDPDVAAWVADTVGGAAPVAPVVGAAVGAPDAGGTGGGGVQGAEMVWVREIIRRNGGPTKALTLIAPHVVG